MHAEAHRAGQGGQGRQGQDAGGDPGAVGDAGVDEQLGQAVQHRVAPHPAEAAGQGPDRWGWRQGHDPRQGQHPDGADEGAQAQAPAGGARVALGHATEARDHHQGGGDPGGEAERLDAGVGELGAGRAEEVVGGAGRGRVPAGIGGVIAGEGGDQDQAEGGHQAPPQPREGGVVPAHAHAPHHHSPGAVRHQPYSLERQGP